MLEFEDLEVSEGSITTHRPLYLIIKYNNKILE